jgi:glycosyltransferase involved in cell wall biosynthesis
MAEAMAKGNAIVSRNVGQTWFFVKDGINGLLIKNDTPAALADELERIIKDPAKVKTMGEESMKLLNTVHTFNNFAPQIEEYFDDMIAKQNK